MAYNRESTTDNHLDYPAEMPDIDASKRPDWVNLTSLDGQYESLFDKMLYKPALRFHGLTGGLWGQPPPSGPQSVITDSRPPSYKVKDPLASTYLYNDTSTSYDQSSLRNNAVSRLTLRRRNTIAVVLVAVALLAAIAATTGVILHFIQPKALLRANVRLTIANQNFTEEMKNQSSDEFREIKRPLCGEMDIYFLTSPLAEFYYGCKVVSLSKAPDSDNVAVHYTLDFSENSVTNDKERIKRIILDKSGRHHDNDTLFLVIDDFLVYLRSLRVDLEVVPMDKRPQRPWIPWRNDIDFINRESYSITDTYTSMLYSTVLLSSSSSSINSSYIPQKVLPDVHDDVLPLLNYRVYSYALNVTTNRKALFVSGIVLSDILAPVFSSDVMVNKNPGHGTKSVFIQPTKTVEPLTRGEYLDPNDVPLAREFAGLRQERIEKNSINTIIDKAHTNGIQVQRHRDAFVFNNGPYSDTQTSNQLETSFNPILSIASTRIRNSVSTNTDNMKLQHGDQKSTEKKKVLKLYSDVFMIVGSESDIMLSGNALQFHTTQMPLNTATYNNATSSNESTLKSIETATPETESISHAMYVITITQNEIRKQANSNTSYDILPSSKTNKRPVSEETHKLNTNDSTHRIGLSQSIAHMIGDTNRSFETTSHHPTIAPTPSSFDTSSMLIVQLELNEMVVEEPIRSAIPVDESIPTDIQWINVLTLPGKITSLHVNAEEPATDIYVPYVPSTGTTGGAKKQSMPLDYQNFNNADDRHNLPTEHSPIILRHNPTPSKYNLVPIRHNPVPFKHNPVQNRPFPISESESSIPMDSAEQDSEILPFPKDDFNFTTSEESDVLLPSNEDKGKDNVRINAFKNTPTNPRPANSEIYIAGTMFHPQNILHQVDYEPRKGKHLDMVSTVNNPMHNSKPHIETQRIVSPIQALMRLHTHIQRSALRPTIQTSPRRNRQRSANLFEHADTSNNDINSHHATSPIHALMKDNTHIPQKTLKPTIHSKPRRNNGHLTTRRKQTSYTQGMHGTHFVRRQNTYYTMFAPGLDRFVNSASDTAEASPAIHQMSHRRSNHHWQQNQLKTMYTGNTLPHTNNNFVKRKHIMRPNYNKYSLLKYDSPLWQSSFVPWTYFQASVNTYGNIGGGHMSFPHYWGPYILTVKRYLQPFWYKKKTIDGLTDSYNVSDIYEMKEILKHLIDAMHNMSNKLDKMQVAINFINATLHETKQPIHKLGDTFENMTQSFDNFNRNLNDITEILNEFKDFLQPFEKTIFNIDDIIDHIDRTVSNLGKTRSYVGVSMQDLSDSVNMVTGTISDFNSSLKHVNMSVFHVNTTAAYTNRTLDSMEKTLETLDDAIKNINLKIGGVKGNIDEINISLSSINKTVQTSNSRLLRLQGRMNKMNGTVKRIKNNIINLNDTYRRINETLQYMNEPIMITEGTVLEVVDRLGSMDGELMNISSSMVNLGEEVDAINNSLDATVQWMGHMIQALNKFNVTVETSNDTISISLKNIDLIDTVGVLLKLNNTINTVQDHVDRSDVNIGTIEFSLDNLESNLQKLDDMLQNMNHTFNALNDTLKDVNSTLHEVQHPLKSMNENIKRVTYSFNDLSETFENINRTLDVANRTLNKVNSTKNEIQRTLYSVRDTLDETDETVARVTSSVANLNNTLEHLDGPLNNIKNELYYANETLKLMKDKVNTTMTTFYNLNDTLNGINATLSELVKNLGETERWLQRTNTSLQDVNKTIEAIETTYDEMNGILDIIQPSFNATLESLQDFRTAFPTLRGKVDHTANELKHLQDQVGVIHQILSSNLVNRDNAVDDFNDMMRLFKTVKNDVVSEIEAFRDALDYLFHVDENLNGLVDSVASTEKLFSKLASNVDILEHSLSPLKVEHNNLLDKSSKLSENLHTTSDALHMLKQEKSLVLDLARDYSNLRLPANKINNLIKNQGRILSATNESFASLKPRLETAGEDLWDRHGNPVNIHDDTDTLLRRIRVVGKEFEDFDKFSRKSDSDLETISANEKKILDLLKHINITTVHIDEINDATARIDDELNKTETRIQSSTDDFSRFDEELNSKITLLDELKLEFSKVNGTAAVADQYAQAESIINKMESQIQLLIAEAKNASHILFETKLKYSFANDSFHETPISIDASGDTLIKNTFEALQETDSNLGLIDGKITDIEYTNILLDLSMKQLDRYTESLRDQLENKTQHYIFVETNRPSLTKYFKNAKRDFTNTSETFQRLEQMLYSLQASADKIENRSLGMNNVDMSIDGENRLIKALNMSLTELKNEVDMAFQKYETTNKHFQLFNPSDEELKSVKDEYSRYQHVLKNLNRVLANVGIETSVIERRMDDLSQEFTTLLNNIDNYYITQHNLEELEHNLNSMTRNMNETTMQMTVSSSKVKEIKESLSNIHDMFADFAAASFNISDQPVNDDFRKVVDMFTNISIDFIKYVIKGNETKSTFYDTKHKLLVAPLSRYNIKRVIDNDINPTNHEIEKEVGFVNASLNDIKSRLNNLNIDLFVINDTLKQKNDRLLVDKKKEQLADNKFPNLAGELYELRDMLSHTIDSMEGPFEKYNKTLNYMGNIYDTIDQIPTIKIPASDNTDKMNNVYDNLTHSMNNLKGLNDLISSVNNTIWIDGDKRYLHDESIPEIEERYFKAANDIRVIKEEISHVTEIIDKANITLENISTTLDKLNSSIFNFKRLSDDVNKIDKHVYDQRIELKEIMRNLNETGKYIETLHSNINETRHRFKDINQVVLHTGLNPIVINTSYVRTKYRKALDDLEEVARLVDNHTDTMHEVRQAMFETIRDPKSLENIVISTDAEILHFLPKIQASKKKLNHLENQTSPMSKELMSINASLDEAIKEYYRQEKEEFYDKNFQTSSYDKIGNLIGNARRTNKELTDLVMDGYDSLAYLIDNHTYTYVRGEADLNIDNFGWQLEFFNRTLTNNAHLIEELNKLHADIITHFHAKDGAKVSDNETINEMKERFEILNNTLKFLQDQLAGLKEKQGKRELEKLNNQNEIMAYITRQLIDLQFTSTKLDQLNDQQLQLNLSLTNIQSENDNHLSELDKIQNDINTLEVSFPDVHNDQINNTKEHINSIQRILSNAVYSVKNEIDDNTKDFQDLSKTIEELFHRKKKGFTDIDSITSFLTNFSNKETLIQTELNHINQSLIYTGDKIQSNEWPLRDLAESVDLLKKQLLQQQKQNYIDANSPDLQSKLHHAKTDLRNTRERISYNQNEVDLLQKLLDSVETTIANNSLIEIKFDNVTEILNDMNRGLDKYQQQMSNLNTTLNSIDTEMFNPFTKYFGENKTVADIEMKYALVDETLHKANKSFIEALDYILAVKKRVNDNHIYLDELLNELDTRNDILTTTEILVQKHTAAVERIVKIDNELLNIDSSVSRLNDILQLLKDRFWNVSDPTLLNERSQIEAAIIDIENQHTKSLDSLDDMKYQHTQTKIDVVRLKLNNNYRMSTSLNELHYSHNISAKYINTINSNLSDIETKLDKAVAKNINMNNNTTVLLEKLIDLEYKFSEKQINQFVNATFPSILEKIDVFENVLKRLSRNISDAEGRMKNIALKMEKTKLKAIPVDLDTTFSDISPIHDLVENETLESKADHRTLKEELHNFVLSLNSEKNSRETLHNISKRFKLYNNSLNEMFDRAIPIDRSIKQIQSLSNKTNQLIDEYGQEISSYKDANDRLQSHRGSAEHVERQINKSKSDMKERDHDIKFLQVQMSFIDERFQHVNHSELDEAKRLIQSKISELEAEKSLHEETIMRLKDDLNTVQNTIENELTKGVQTVSNINHLQSLLDDKNRLMDAVGNRTNNIDDEIVSFVTNVLPVFSSHINDTNTRINELISRFEEQEKRDYIERNLPTILNEYDAINQFVSKTKNVITQLSSRLKSLNGTVQDLEGKISNIQNVFIPLRSLRYDVFTNDEYIKHMSDLLDTRQDKLNDVDLNQLSPETLQTLPLKDVQSIFDNLNRLFNETSDSMQFVSKNTDSIRDSLGKNEQHIHETNELLSRYARLNDTSNTVGDRINEVNNYINDTSQLLKKVNSDFGKHAERFKKIEKEFAGVNNPTIDSLYEKAKQLVNMVDLRLPLVNELYNNKTLGGFDSVTKEYKHLKNDLNSLVTDNVRFKEVLDKAESNLFNISNDLDTLVKGERHYAEEGLTLQAHLDEFNDITDQLEKSMKAQRKREYLEEQLPLLRSHFQNTSDITNQINSSLTNTLENTDNINNTLKSLENIMNEKPSLHIPLDDQLEYMNKAKQSIKAMVADLKNTNEKLAEMPLYEIEVENIVANESLSFTDVKDIINSIKSPLSGLDSVLSNTQDKIFDIESTVADIRKDSMHLQDTLINFETTERNFKSFGSDVKEVEFKRNMSSNKLNKANETINALKTELMNTKDKFSEFNPEDKHIKSLIENVENQLKSITNSYKMASGVSDAVNAEFSHMNDTLYNIAKSESQLNRTLKYLQDRYQGAAKTLENVTGTFDDILDNFYPLEKTLAMIGSEIKQLNNSMKKEEDKSFYVNENLPELKKKYQETNFTFVLMNKTFEDMETKLKELDNFVDRVSSKMDIINNINVSMINVTNNLTHMENRIFIMKEHYNNIKDFVSNLHNDLEAGSKHDKNVTLQDIEQLFSSYNLSIDKVDTILGKIDMEFTEMDDQFDFFNDTLITLDNALNKYEELAVETGLLNETIANLSNTLAKKDKKVMKMKEIIDALNSTFGNLQEIYTDVFTKTTHENDHFRNALLNASDLVENVQRLLNNLGTKKMQVENGFNEMNETLRQYISSSDKLFDMLFDVHQYNEELFDSLNILNENITTAKNHTDELGSFLSNVDTLLKILNKTLHSEQIKHNYITSNLGEFGNELYKINSKLDETKQALIGSENKLVNATSAVAETNDRISKYPSVNFKISNNTLESLDKGVAEMNHVLTNMIKTFNDLKTSISQSDDSAKNMSDLNERYSKMNDTLKWLKHGLSGLQDNIFGANNQTDKVVNNAFEIASTLDTFDKVEDQKKNIKRNIDVLNGNKTELAVSLTSIESTLDIISEKIKNQIKDYENVETAYSGQMMKKLEDQANKHLNKSVQLNDLKKKFKKFSENFMSANDDSKYIERLLQTPLQSLDQMQYVTNSSEQLIPGVEEDVNGLQINADILSSSLNKLQDEISNIHKGINNLNETLFEEKQKEKFINTNFKLLNQTFSKLDGKLDKSNNSLALSLERTTGITGDLAKLAMRLDTFTAINISLDTEKKLIEEEKRKIKEMLDLHATLSASYKQLHIEALTNTNKTFEDVKRDYERFESEMKRIENLLGMMNDSLMDTNSRLSTLNTSLSDINNTVDNYEDMEQIISDQTEKSMEASNSLNTSKEAAIELEKQINQLNKSLADLDDTFSQINDPNLKAIKKNLEDMLNNFKTELDDLKHVNNEMDMLSTGIKQNIDSVNDTLYSTKKILDTLKKHIQQVNQSSKLLEKDLKDVHSKQSSANDTLAGIKPGLDKILEGLKNLSTSFGHEQEKFDFISKHKPVLEADHKNLEDEFNDINKRISLTEFQLADLRYSIKTTDAKLEKFITLDITTRPEMEAWTGRSNAASDLSTRFVRLSSRYSVLKDDIKNLNYMNSTEQELQQKVNSIKDSLTEISTDLDAKNDTLKDINKKNTEAESVLEDLNETMRQFKQLQLNGEQTHDLMGNTLTAMSNSTGTADKVKAFKELITDKLKTMEKELGSVIDRTWTRELSSLKHALSFEGDKLKLNIRNLGSLEDAMQTTTAAFNKTYKQLKEQKLTRTNVKRAMRGLDKNIRTTNMTFTDTASQIKDTDSELSRLNTSLTDIWNKLSALSDSMYLEWEKASFVNETLPELQQKLFLVNSTFAANIPSSTKLKTQVSYLTVILENIERKMKLYKIPDVDGSIKQWKNMITGLNDTVNDIIDKNEKSDNQLVDLRGKLWSDDPMYTTAETLTDVQKRFAEFNRTLNDISLSSHSINMKLRGSMTESGDIVNQLENKDAGLTTTTTPSAPPDWLSFRSSGTGTIAEDKGLLVCSATQLKDWDIMKITRISPDGTEQDMAAWKQGIGARKPRNFSDRRVRVKRVINPRGGGSLQVGITSIQCVDEAQYLCSVDTHNMWPLKTKIDVISPPEDSLEPDFPTEVFEDKVANFSCTGRPGYPNGKITWKVRHGNEAFFKDFDFYSARRTYPPNEKCTRTETNTVGYQFDMKWNNTRIRCYIENTDYFGEGIIRILPYTICNNVRDLGKIRHPYTPHKYIVCDRGLNIMQCPGNTCYDETEENCVQCKASVTGGDPCRGQPLFSYVAHETDCKKYYICMGPTKSTKRCSKGYFAQNAPGHCVLSYQRSECARNKG